MDIDALRPVVVSIAGSNPIQNVLNVIVTELAQHRDVALVRIWLRGPATSAPRAGCGPNVRIKQSAEMGH